MAYSRSDGCCVKLYRRRVIGFVVADYFGCLGLILRALAHRREGARPALLTLGRAINQSSDIDPVFIEWGSNLTLMVFLLEAFRNSCFNQIYQPTYLIVYSVL